MGDNQKSHNKLMLVGSFVLLGFIIGLIVYFILSGPNKNGGKIFAVYVKGDIQINVYSGEYGVYTHRGVVEKGYGRNVLELDDKRIGKVGSSLILESKDWDRNVTIDFTGKEQRFIREVFDVSTGMPIKLYIYLSWQDRLRSGAGWSLMVRKDGNKKGKNKFLRM